MSQVRILNRGELPGTTPHAEVAGRLRAAILRLKTEFFDPGRGRVDYEGLRQSPAYAHYLEETRLLAAYDPKQLHSRQERLAFWINLYNALVIHGVIELGIKESVREVSDFFRRIAYRIGDQVFTPDDIEHGILRGNRAHPHGLFAPFSVTDPRFPLILDPPDPRIHFALVCGSSSCPPIHYFTPERIEEQLDLAATGFINGPEVEISPRENLLRLSPIFKWYRADFGGHEGMLGTLIRYLDPGETRHFLIERGMGADVEWKEYDWRLNR